MILPLAVTVALMSSAQPPPKNAAPQAQGTKLEQGVRAFNDGQLDVALKALDAAAAEASDPATLEKIHLLRGQCLAARQDFGKAEDAFAMALDANPEAALDPGKVDPAVVKLLESMRGRLSGELDVQTTPAGADVVIDGKPAGSTPLQRNLPIGRHRVEAKWPDAVAAPLDVVVRNKRETQVTWVAVTVEKQVVVTKEVVVEKPVPVPIVPPPQKIRFFGDVRGGLDVNAGPEGGLDIGLGLEVPAIYLRFEAAARVYPYFHIIPRIAGVIPLAAKDFDVFLEVGLPIRFPSNDHEMGVAFHGGAGAEWNATNVFTVYVEAGGTFYFVNPSFVVDDRFTAAAGVRLRIP
jgi:hypothetical protein